MVGRRQFLVSVAGSGLAAWGGSATALEAQTWPSRPVKLMIAFPPGGPTDITMRVLAENVAQLTGQPVVVENKPGSGGAMPAMLLQTAPPDGYTLAQAPLGVYRLPYTQKLSWDPMQDLSYIAGVSGYALGVVVAADSPFGTWGELMDWARNNPGRLSYGSTGVLTSPHLTMEDIAIRLKLQFNHVPYRGSAELVQAVLSGQVMAAADSSGFIPQVEAGRLRLLCTWGKRRMPRFPNVPTLTELGLPIVQDSPYGVVGPGGLDARLVERIHEVFKRAMEMPNHIEALARFDQQLAYLRPDDYKRFAVETMASERAIIEKLGLSRQR